MTVRHSRGEYPISFVGLEALAEAIPPGSVAITDENVRNLYGHLLPAQTVAIAPGEASKCLSTYEATLRWAAQSGLERSGTIVAFGGGVVGDLAGFVAATYMRGVRLVQVPTTLLAQVDSSVGGKVGVDLPQGKNLVGVFYPPEHVVVCVEVLRTLSDREFRNGMAEVWKYGFIMDAELIEELQDSCMEATSPVLEKVVRRCIELKAQVIEADEFETTGRRAILNFGHTIGHAIEQLSAYALLHGEAISIGMAAEARLGERLGVTPAGASELVKNCLLQQGLPVASELLGEPSSLIELMKRDKKAKQGSLAFSLLTRIGGCKLIAGVSEQEVEAALAFE